MLHLSSPGQRLFFPRFFAALPLLKLYQFAANEDSIMSQFMNILFIQLMSTSTLLTTTLWDIFDLNWNS